MKKSLLTLLFCFSSFLAFCQIPPQAMSYQAIAYDSTNTPIINGSVSLRISIYDIWAAGNLVYQETFSGVTTDNQGVFSLNIGEGTPVASYQFKNINWGINEKFLKVEMDPTGGTTYALVGTNKLVSVPYALYSKSSSASTSIATVDSITALRFFVNFDKNVDVPTVYVQGYNVPSDGGGGTFVFKRYSDMGVQNPPAVDSKRPDNDDGIFIDSFDQDLRKIGIWVRQFDTEVDVRFYGVTGNWYGIDETTKIQNAIDYAAKSVANINDRAFGYNKTNTVFIPNGNYGVSQLVLKSGVKLRGASKQNTIISPAPKTDDSKPLIIINQGENGEKAYVVDVHVSDMSFYGLGEHSTKACIYIEGRTGANGSGLWNSSFKNINISNFRGYGMRFVGGTGTHRDGIEYSKVNQFIQFEDVNIEGLGNLLKDGDAFYYPLSIVGLNGQFSFSNCRFDGSQHIEGSENNNVNGTNVYIGMVDKEHAATPNLINFDTCTFQHGIVGIFTDSSNGININRCWFENLDRAIMVSGTQKKSKSINIMNNLFGRSAGFRDDETYDSKGSVIVYSNSQINVMNNACGNNGLNGETVNFIRLETDPSSGKPLANLGANTFGNSFVDYIEGDSILEDQEQRFSYGVGKAINLNEVTGSTILTENAKLIYLSTSEPEIKTIDEMISFVSAGELICIRVDKGYVRFNESKNIYLGNMADPDPSTSHPNGQLTINQGGFALFVKSDDGNFRETYNLISYKNRE